MSKVTKDWLIKQRIQAVKQIRLLQDLLEALKALLPPSSPSILDIETQLAELHETVAEIDQRIAEFGNGNGGTTI